jgi:hypothetical protein
MPLVPGTDDEWDVMKLGAENCCVLLEQAPQRRVNSHS